jgi:hypothetical protein
MIGLVQYNNQLPEPLRHMGKHPYFRSLPLHVNESTRINTWASVRIRIPTSKFYCKELIQRVYAQLSQNCQEAQCDTIFYVPTDSPGVQVPELETIQCTR